LFFADGTSGADAYRGWVEYGHTGNEMTFGTNGGTKLTLTSAGNLGLGVTPSAWSGYTAFDIAGGASLSSASLTAIFSNNAFFNGSSWIYKSTGTASDYFQSSGSHVWRTAASGTAGNPISFTQAMTLTAAGNLGIGSTSPDSYRLKTVGAGFVFTGTNYFNVGIHDGSAAQRGVAFGYDSGSQTGIIAAETAGAASTLAFYTFNGSAWGERAKINSFGVGLGGATPSSGTGITFPATQSASSDANTLDDYEEGTWEPNQGSGLTVVGTFSSVGRYTKIGNMVTVWGQVTGSTSVSVSSAGTICTNLPFALEGSVGINGIATGYFTANNAAAHISIGATTSVAACQALAAAGSIGFTITYRF
jgi:hypothetical protein